MKMIFVPKKKLKMIFVQLFFKQLLEQFFFSSFETKQ